MSAGTVIQNGVSSVERSIFSLAYQKTPLLFKGGIANSFPITPSGVAIPGGLLPVSAVVDAFSAVSTDIFSAIDGSGGVVSLDDLFQDWTPQSSVLFDTDIATYPFANQAVAANAQITNPLRTSALLKMPPHLKGHYSQLPLIIYGLEQMFNKHRDLGGTYVLLTPPKIWTDIVLTRFHDVTEDPDHAPGSQFLLEFEKPLVNASQLSTVLGSLMSRFQSGAIGAPQW